ncbi:MAG TPA: hypothetical protein VLA73_01760, partial [Burkholderiales bacterium]|nr:hypothetical protein [Burkholderiales bacterium]
MRILLVGCRDLFYEGIMRLAKDIGDDPELVHAQGSTEAIELASGAALDLALFDLDALDADPVASIREFLGRFEKTPVIGL